MKSAADWAEGLELACENCTYLLGPEQYMQIAETIAAAQAEARAEALEEAAELSHHHFCNDERCGCMGACTSGQLCAQQIAREIRALAKKDGGR